jgi:segregation and condensation protein A
MTQQNESEHATTRARAGEEAEHPWPDGGGPLRRAPQTAGAEGTATGPVVAAETESGERLIVSLGEFEGPLDLLLDLARRQKVDLTEISVLALAEQYLAFIREARRMRLELAADWLVMAAWLAWLKSRLLLPEPPEEPQEEPPAEELAARLAFRLKRLQAMREAAERLMARPRLGVDVFARGMPQPTVVAHVDEYEDGLVDLLRAYAGIVRRQVDRRGYEVRPQPVWTIKEARETLERLVGTLGEWSRLDALLMAYLAEPGKRRSAIASGFAAALELAREGELDIRQEGHFRPIYCKAAR